MSASYKYASVPNIDLSGERMLDTKLRKSRGKGGKPKIRKQLISVLNSLPSDLLNMGETNTTILDTV